MSRIEQGKTLLRRAEEGLREIMGEAAATGDYESVLVLTAWAKQLTGLTQQNGEPPATICRVATEKLQAGTTATAANSPRGRNKVTPKKATRNRKRKATQSTAYPRFLRRGDDIVKIGWSKRSKDEYQHKAPQKVISLLVATLVTKGAGGSLVTANDLIPLSDPGDHSEIPDYQVYLCLAWLRHEGLIEQEGRQGYLVSDSGSLDTRAKEKWESLPLK